jgi:hypothetical protein
MRGARGREQKSPAGVSKPNENNCGLAANRASEGLQFLAGLEAHGFAGRNADFLAGARIAADASLAWTHIKHTEASQLDSFSFSERVLHRFKHSFDRLFGLGPAHSGLIYDSIYNVQLNHT